MARDPLTSMWDEACHLLEQAERLHRQFFRRATSAARRYAWEPPVDITGTEEEMSVAVALPGVPPARIEVVVDVDELIVRAERPLPDVAGGGHIHRLEIPYGRFERRIDLPGGPYELLRQELRLGCLLLTLRRQHPSPGENA